MVTSAVIDLCAQDMSALSAMVARRELSPVEIVEACLDRVARLDGRLHAFVRVVADEARARAAEAEAEIAAGRWRGALHGLPFGAKDLLASGQIPAEVGMPLYRGRNTAAAATAIARLEAAGAILIGKLRQTEGTLSGYHPDDPLPMSPWRADHWPGASSSGSGIALAARMIPAALSSDTGGSIRTPSALCGVTGLMPSKGLVSLAGAFPVAPSLDRLGPMARSARDCAMVLNAIAGYDPLDPISSRGPAPDYLAQLDEPLPPLVVGLPSDALAGVDATILDAMEACRRTLTSLGVRFVDVAYPVADAALRAWVALCMASVAVVHEEVFKDHADGFGPALTLSIQSGQRVTTRDLIAAIDAREALDAAMDHVFGGIDALLTPVLMASAPTVQDLMASGGDMGDAYVAQARFQGPFNMTGQPSLTFPAGRTADGLPIGLQLAGRRMGEISLLRLVDAFQQETDWHRMTPPLAN